MKMLNNKLKLIALDLQFCNILYVYRRRWCNNPHSFCMHSHTILLIKLYTHGFPPKYAISQFFPHSSASITHAILFHWRHGSFFHLIGDYFQVVSSMGYSRKNPNSGLWGYTFLKKPLEFLGFLSDTFTLRNSRHNSFNPKNSAILQKKINILSMLLCTKL